MAEGRGTSAPEWQNIIKDRLMAKQAETEVYREMIEQYKRLAKTARDLKVRNRMMLRSGVGPSATADGTPSPLISHLDAQLTTLRAELSTLYRSQAAAQNKQLSLSDALRDRDEEVRGLREEVRTLREQRDGLNRRESDWTERWKMRGKDLEASPRPSACSNHAVAVYETMLIVQTLNDELLSLNLEISALTDRNAALQSDNAQLLQRWLDKMNLTAEEMNDDFEREAERRGSQDVERGATTAPTPAPGAAGKTGTPATSSPRKSVFRKSGKGT